MPHLLGHLARRFVRRLIRLYYPKVEVTGREWIPTTGPVLLAANHANSLIDPVIVGIAARRSVRFFAKAPLFETPVLGRLMRALCFVRSEPKDNGFARPLDGVVVVFDLNQMKVVRIEDYGVTPLPPEAGNWARDYIPKTRSGLKPLDIVQPEGASYTVNGHEVRWQNWRFRIGFTPREGLVLHTVSYTDEGTDRQILYRASVCEMGTLPRR